MSTYHIHIEGQVQGVGFRPFVYKLARRYGLTGTVSNGVDGVHIYARGDDKTVWNFYDRLIYNPPKNAFVKRHSIQNGMASDLKDFRIIESDDSGKPNLLLTPDLGICDKCRNEIWDEANRRYQYAFTTCLECGPRFSIIKGLPYDRPLTSMHQFEMCPSCDNEYRSPLNRRFFSQTNSCPDCRVHMFWHDQRGKLVSDDDQEIITLAINALKEEKIIAIKGIGGFLLMADATSERALNTLRHRKHRPSKPFAILYSNEHVLKGDVHIDEQSMKEWAGIESPIILFPLKDAPESGIQTDLIAPGLNRIGAMQPYAPLLELIASHFERPLVATSGNISGYPIFYTNREAVQNLGEVVDFFLTNDRDIVVPQDDSVIGFTEIHRQKVVFRRSRGYAPNLIIPNLPTDQNILATGASLKSTFGMTHEGNTYVSQYIGDTATYDVQESYQHTLDHMSSVLQFYPDLIVADLHPEYFTTRLAEDLSFKYMVPIQKVQHHKAHFASILAEHQLTRSKDPVLGVIWDGTGYGEDGQIWGGEFFTFSGGEFNRETHFEYFDHLLGDKMAMEPRISALSISKGIDDSSDILGSKFSDKEWSLYQRLFKKEDGLKTSSVGRLFDAIASLTGLCDKQSFEGEAAMLLQVAAEEYLRDPDQVTRAYSVDSPSPQQITAAILKDLDSNFTVAEIAAKFHLTLVRIIRKVAEKVGIKSIAFSGGVFQNMLLVDLIIDELENDFELYFHKKLSPNDENISFGQLIYAQMMKEGEPVPEEKLLMV